MFQKIIAFFMTIIAFFAQLFGINIYPQSGNKITENLNVSYGASANQVFDLYLPEKAGDVPLILFIHGGGWIGGDKNAYTEAAKSNVKKAGYAAASMNYRLLKEMNVSCDELMEDITTVLAKIKEIAASKGYNIRCAALCGYSAGAHMAMLYAYKYKDISPVELRFVVSQAGPTDLTDPEYLLPENTLGEEFIYPAFSLLSKQNITKENIGTPGIAAGLRAVSPLYYVNENSLPTIFCHGKKDITVPFSNALKLDKALTDAKVEHSFIIYDNSDHGLDRDTNKASEFINVYSAYADRYFK